MLNIQMVDNTPPFVFHHQFGDRLPPGAGDLQQRQTGPALGGLRRPHVARKAGARCTRFFPQRGHVAVYTSKWPLE